MAMPRQYKQGQRVPTSGIYRVRHENDHLVEYDVTCIAGKTFPRCHGCVHPRFALTQEVHRIESRSEFRLSKSKAHASSRRTGLFIIIGCLVLVGLIGVYFIRSAPRLADIPWIKSAAEAVLFPKTPAGTNPPDEEEERELLITFFSEVGIAFIVAVILGVTLEIFMRRREERLHHRHVAEIEKAALSSLLGSLMPASISDEVRRVFEEKIMRSNLKVRFMFENAPPSLQNADDLVMVKVMIEYDVVNLTRKATKYDVDHGFETVLAVGGSHNKFVRLEVTQGEEVILHWPHGRHANLVRAESPKPCMRTLEVKDLIELGPGSEIEQSRKDNVRIVVEHQVVRRRADQDSWRTWLPADCLDVEAIIVPNCTHQLDFHLERTHPVRFAEETLSETHRVWYLPSTATQVSGEDETQGVGVLPYQGFTLYWFPRDDPDFCST